MALRTQPKVLLRSSDRELERGFDRAKRQALEWVFEGYPVGDYYEAALPNREAFCMRDVSHQCTGGEVLGLSSHNKNMFRKFAQAIDESRDWCSYWEIDRWDRPCPVDYKDDQDFWYNLPANFDVLHACYRMYLWTGDRDYLSAADFDRFHALTMEDYIRRWDRDGDGIPDRDPAEGRRGVAGYAENPHAFQNLHVATDTVAAMTRAHLSYASMCGLLGRREQEAIYRKRGEALLERLHTEFADEGGYILGLTGDGKPLGIGGNHSHGFLFYWDVMDDSRKEALLDGYAAEAGHTIIEHFSHMPELLWRYGRRDQALSAFRGLTAPALERREYPEASYSAVGAAATGLMGLCPNAPDDSLSTLSGLADVEWAELAFVPLLGREITVAHWGDTGSSLTVEAGEALLWKASFRGTGAVTSRQGPVEAKVQRCPYSGETLTVAELTIGPGETVKVEFQRG